MLQYDTTAFATKNVYLGIHADSRAKESLCSATKTFCDTIKQLLYQVLGQNPPGQNPPGQNPLDKIPLDKIPPRTKSPRTKSPWTKSPHYIPPNCSIAQYFLLYINVIFESQFSSTFVRCDIFHGDEVEKRS